MKAFVVIDVPEDKIGEEVTIFLDRRYTGDAYQGSIWTKKLRPYQKSACEYCFHGEKKQEDYPCNKCKEIHASTENKSYFEKKLKNYDKDLISLGEHINSKDKQTES